MKNRKFLVSLFIFISLILLCVIGLIILQSQSSGKSTLELNTNNLYNQDIYLTVDRDAEKQWSEADGILGAQDNGVIVNNTDDILSDREVTVNGMRNSILDG